MKSLFKSADDVLAKYLFHNPEAQPDTPEVTAEDVSEEVHNELNHLSENLIQQTGNGSLRQGARGPQVAALQQILGMNLPANEVGIFGPKTRRAVAAKQAELGMNLSANEQGIFGNKTRAALRAAMSGQPVAPVAAPVAANDNTPEASNDNQDPLLETASTEEVLQHGEDHNGPVLGTETVRVEERGDAQATSERLVQTTERQDAFYESIGGMGEDLLGLSRDLAESEYNTTGKTAEEIQAYMESIGITKEQTDGRKTVEWRFDPSIFNKEVVVRPDTSKADLVMGFLTGEAASQTEDLNTYRLSKLDKAVDTWVMNTFFDRAGNAIEDIDGTLFKSTLGIRQNRTQFRRLRELTKTIQNEETPAAEKRAAGLEAYEIMHTEFDDDLAEARADMIDDLREDRGEINIDGQAFEYDFREVKDQHLDGKEYSTGYWFVKVDGDWQRASEALTDAQMNVFKEKVIDPIEATIQGSERYQRIMENFAGKEAGMEEIQRELIIGRVAALRAEGMDPVQIKTELKDYPRAEVDQAIAQQRAADQARLDSYLANAKREFTAGGELQGVDRNESVAGTAYHGPDMTTMNGVQLDSVTWDYLKGVTPHENPEAQGNSSAYLIADSFARQGYAFSEGEFQQMFSNKQVMSVAEAGLSGEHVFNTSGDLAANERAKPLRDNDTLVKLNPVTRAVEIMVNGQPKTVDLKYNVFLRAGCANPIIQPDMEYVGKQLVEYQTAELIELPQGKYGKEGAVNGIAILLAAAGAAGLTGGGGGGLLKDGGPVIRIVSKAGGGAGGGI